jgi:integrase
MFRFPAANAAVPYRAHNAACRRARCYFVLYSLRHTFATRLAERGAPLPVIAAILGHASLRCVHRYVHPSQAAMDAAVIEAATATMTGEAAGAAVL